MFLMYIRLFKCPTLFSRILSRYACDKRLTAVGTEMNRRGSSREARKKSDSCLSRKSSEPLEDLSSCLNVREALLIRDTSRALALDYQRAKSYRAVKKFQEESRRLRFTELYGPEWDSSGLEKSLNAISSLGLPRKLHNRFDTMKKKMNKLMHGKRGNELFLDINELEYPRANETLRLAFREQWQEYYDCLQQRLEEAGPEKTTYPIALLALEGTSVTLKCKLCVSPAEMHTSESIEWFFNSSSNASIAEVPVETSEHVLVTPDERDLNLYNIQMGQAGIYWCQLEDTASAPYYLNVANEETEKTRPVRPETAPRAENHPTPPENLEEYGLRVFSSWSAWSPCSACDRVGQKIRYGYCTISLIDNNAHRFNANESAPLAKHDSQKRSILSRRWPRQVIDEETSTSVSETTTEMSEQTTVEEAEEESEEKDERKSPEELRDLARGVLPIFRNRLPCRSPYTPKDIQKIGKIGNRPTEIMTGFCKIKCQENVVFEIRDKSGNVLESANNSAGIYSMAQGMPEPRPSVERVTIYRRHDKKAELRCPGNLNSDVPVIWQIGTKILAPSVIKSESDGRISIDSRQQIVFKKLRFADANIYSCWQRGELAGTIRLEVTSAPYLVEPKVDHRVFMIGAIAIISVFLTVFWRAFKGRKRFTMH